jgi:hypothetical protein
VATVPDDGAQASAVAAKIGTSERDRVLIISIGR